MKRPEPKFKRGDKIVLDPERFPSSGNIGTRKIGGCSWNHAYKEYEYMITGFVNAFSEYELKIAE